ncbi:DHH family phosphoesterase [Patescibacteria group bacterium]|nr:DHH family phosphoesterase [Patescibacteria group bacterium]
MPEIKNLKKAAQRIKEAVLNKERIILSGDADLDGVGSVVMLKEAIKNLGGEVAMVFFPDRENDGYGINEKALNEFKHLAPALFISLDFGIGNHKEVDIGNKMGFDFIIIDHHQPIGKVPNASVVVDPKQEGDKSAFKELANVGLTFKLIEQMIELSDSLRNSFLELVALATIADMMPQIEDNKEFIDFGLDSMRNTFRPGLKVFLDILDKENAVSRIISALNACEKKECVNETYLLLTSSSEKEARVLAERLIEKAHQRQFRVKEIIREVEARIESKSEPLIFEGDPLWPLISAGTVASVICQKYGKPVFIFKKGEKESSGSVRVPRGINSVNAMESCSSLLITYGGHPPASGFRLRNDNLEKFKTGLIKYFK